MAIELGLLSPLYAILKDGFKWVTGKFQKPDPAKVAQARTQWKAEFEANLRWIDNKVGFGGAVVRDLKRMDGYPNSETPRKGISPWFRVGLLGLYHRGVEVGLGIEAVKHIEDVDAWMLTSDYEGKTLNAYLVGRIPFEWIEAVDWRGDEYYGQPHIYCTFASKRGEPYEEVLLSERRWLDNRPYYVELAKYDDARKLQKQREPKRAG